MRGTGVAADDIDAIEFAGDLYAGIELLDVFDGETFRYSE